MSTEVAAALIGGLIGFTAAIIPAVLGYLERKRAKRDDILFQAFQLLAGNAEKRNIGTSIIEGYWHEVPHLRGVLVPLLTNQAIYLLSHSHQSEALHEQDNLRRIMGLLLAFPDGKKEFDDYFKMLLKVLEAKKADELSGGIPVGPTTLDTWLRHLKHRCG